jgi:formylglycine-generating enzyme required for sulfatase activity
LRVYIYSYEIYLEAPVFSYAFFLNLINDWKNKALVNSLIDIAQKMYELNTEELNNTLVSELYSEYELGSEDFEEIPFIRYKKSFRFIHRAFLEFFVLYPLVEGLESENFRTQFDFSKIRFKRLFDKELLWINNGAQKLDKMLFSKNIKYTDEIEEELNKNSNKNEDLQLKWFNYFDSEIRFHRNINASYSRIITLLSQTANLDVDLQNSNWDWALMAAFPNIELLNEIKLSHGTSSNWQAISGYTNLESIYLNKCLADTIEEASEHHVLKILQFQGMKLSESSFETLKRKWPQIKIYSDADFMLQWKVHEIVKDIENQMIEVKGGKFDMGGNAYSWEGPEHSVEISDFKLAKFQVTRLQFAAFVQETGHLTSVEESGWAWSDLNDGYGAKNGINWRHNEQAVFNQIEWQNKPVIYVSWDDAMAFCNWLSVKTGKTYTLPTEAQWEYAAGGGENNRTRWAGTNQENELEKFALYSKNYQGEINDVGQLKSNQLGFYDMSGNVWEWCADAYRDDVYKKSELKNPFCKDDIGLGVVRGGCWYDSAAFCRVAFRSSYVRGNGRHLTGFRVASGL